MGLPTVFVVRSREYSTYYALFLLFTPAIFKEPVK